MKLHPKTTELRKFKTRGHTSLCLSGPLARHPRIEIASIDTLKPSPYNVRKHSKRQIQQLANSMVRFGWLVPIVIDEHRNIVSGHGRREAAKFLGLEEVPVIVAAGLREAEKRAYALADNKIASQCWLGP